MATLATPLSNEENLFALDTQAALDDDALAMIREEGAAPSEGSELRRAARTPEVRGGSSLAAGPIVDTVSSVSSQARAASAAPDVRGRPGVIASLAGRARGRAGLRTAAAGVPAAAGPRREAAPACGPPARGRAGRAAASSARPGRHNCPRPGA